MTSDTATGRAESRLRQSAGRVAWRSLIPRPSNVSALYLLALVFLLFGLWLPGLFLTTATLRLVLAGQVAAAMLTLAILVPFLAGAFDLSVGSMLAFSLVLISWFEQHSVMNMVLACVVAVLICAVAGLVSGLIVIKFRVNSFIATLGVGQILTALALLISSNQQIVGVFPAGFLSFGQGNWLGIPRPVYYLAVVALVAWYVLELTPLGRRLFATGSNQEAARLAGVRTDRLVVGSLVASAAIAGLAGVVFGAQVGNFSNSYGSPLLFPAFAALFFGSTQFRGRPNVWGSILAIYVLAFGVQGVQLKWVQASYWATPLFDGAALLIAVSFAGRQHLAAQRKNKLTPTQAAPEASLPDAATSPGPDSEASRTGS